MSHKARVPLSNVNYTNLTVNKPDAAYLSMTAIAVSEKLAVSSLATAVRSSNEAGQKAIYLILVNVMMATIGYKFNALPCASLYCLSNRFGKERQNKRVKKCNLGNTRAQRG